MGETSDGQAGPSAALPEDADPDSPARSFFSRIFGRDSTDNASPSASRARGPSLNLRALRRLRVDDVSVPRADIVAVPDDATLADLAFAWRACRAVKSNAILLANNGASVGIGMGQVNRVDSCGLAVSRAGTDRARGSVAASDAFFPFPDGPQILIDAGVKAIAQPGGSVRDEEVVAAAQAAGITMYFTGTRHFFH